MRGLLQRLQDGEIDEVLLKYLGEPRVVAKKLGIKRKDGENDGHGFFSNPKKALERLLETHDLTPEFRVVGDFSVEMHILSALWINLVGQEFDKVLSKCVRGSRLRRYSSSSTERKYHMNAIGSFEPYWDPYKHWRADGLATIRQELKDKEKSVIAVTLDITNYYHNIDPSFLIDERLLEYSKIEINEWQHSFTASMVTALQKWSTSARRKFGRVKAGLPVGIPIGLSMSRVIANVLLIQLDREFERSLAPIYYGRYVDDIFLVLADPGDINNVHDLFNFICPRCDCVRLDTERREASLKLQYHCRSLQLQETKQKLFVLEGEAGIDLLDHIESEIKRVSSERRLMPSPDEIESTAAAKILTAATNSIEEVDTLRRADTLSVRRLGWAIQLRKVETLANDLLPKDWLKQRQSFYRFAQNHILRADRILDQIDYLPRLLRIAVDLADWEYANQIAAAAINAIKRLRDSEIVKAPNLNGEVCDHPILVWESFESGVKKCLQEAILCSLPSEESGIDAGEMPVRARALFRLAGLSADDLPLVTSLRESDLAKTAYKNIKPPPSPKLKRGEEALETPMPIMMSCVSSWISERSKGLLCLTSFRRVHTHREKSRDSCLLSVFLPNHRHNGRSPRRCRCAPGRGCTGRIGPSARRPARTALGTDRCVGIKHRFSKDRADGTGRV